MPKADLAELVDVFRRAARVAITSHVGPDGDSVGSALALQHFLRALGNPEVICAMDDPVPGIYAWLPGADSILSSQEAQGDFDLLAIVDVSERDRIGGAARLIGPGTEVVIIDHHLGAQPVADWTFLDPSYSAVGGIIADLFETAGIPLTADAAVCAYVALITDTGGFRYSNTRARSHHIAARLIDAGADPADVARRVFDTMAPEKFQLLKRVIDSAVFDLDGRLGYVSLTPDDYAAAGAGIEHSEGLINFIRNIKGVEAALLFRQEPNGATKVSMRSDDALNAAELLAEFGGGGHAAAAGATIDRSLEEARDAVLERVRAALEDTK